MRRLERTKKVPGTIHDKSPIGSDLRLAVLLGFVSVLPFVILEVRNQVITGDNSSGLILLFGLLWILVAAFILILTQAMRSVSSRRGVFANPWFWLRLASLLSIAVLWGVIVIDQVPCFLGVPNCD
jgi:hypothetical protein